jgi:hypothetical protein
MDSFFDREMGGHEGKPRAATEVNCQVGQEGAVKSADQAQRK